MAREKIQMPEFDAESLLKLYREALSAKSEIRAAAVSHAEKTIEAALEAHAAQLRFAMHVAEPLTSTG